MIMHSFASHSIDSGHPVNWSSHAVPGVLDDDIQLLHNMSKVVYSDGNGTARGDEPPPIPPHNTATRQRHSVAEDYYRQKLYYPGDVTF